MENGLNYMAVAFAMQLVKILLVDERSVAHVTEADLFHTIETLMRINAHSRGNAPEGWAWNTVWCFIPLCLCNIQVIMSYRFKLSLGLQSYVSLNCHSTVIVLGLCQNRGSCSNMSNWMLEQKNLSVCCVPKYHGTVRNLLEFLLYFKFRQYSYLFNFSI